MEVFSKKLTSIDINKGLVLPYDDGTAALPSLDGGPVELPVRFGQDILHFKYCLLGSGKPAFTEGWLQFARSLKLQSGDVIILYKEEDEAIGATFRIELRVMQ